MKKNILPIILLIIYSCSPTETEEVIEGCMDADACNYISNATIQETTICLYGVDECGVCGGNDINEEGKHCTDLRVLQDIIDANPSLSGQSSSNLGTQGWNENNGRLDTLSITGSYLENIPSSIADLSGLSYLDLSANDLTEFPIGISNLMFLKYLYIGNNDLEGELSLIISYIKHIISLKALSLSHNDLSGEIPDDIGLLVNLEHLWLFQNELSGEIPEAISSLENLTRIDLGINQFTGEIPSFIWEMTNLEYLYLYENQFTGNIPSEISNLTHLVALWLNENQLYGPIPDSICDLSIEWDETTVYGGSTFKINDNEFCDTYPSCISAYMGDQDCENR